MRVLPIIALIIGSFIITACGAATGSPPTQPTVAPDQPVPTQPPAATRDHAPPTMMTPEPTAMTAPETPPAQLPTITETPVTVSPTVAPIATLMPTVLPNETPMPIQPMPASNAQPLLPPFDGFVQRQIDTAKQDLAQRLGIDVATIEVASVETVTWPDGSLGCPRPGMAYIQVLIDGLRIVLRVGDQFYPYHSGDNQPPFLCDLQMGPQVKP